MGETTSVLRFRGDRGDPDAGDSFNTNHPPDAGVGEIFPCKDSKRAGAKTRNLALSQSATTARP